MLSEREHQLLAELTDASNRAAAELQTVKRVLLAQAEQLTRVVGAIETTTIATAAFIAEIRKSNEILARRGKE